MVASSHIEIQTKPIEAIQRGLDKIEDAVFAIADEAVVLSSAEHLPRIRQYPPTEAVLPFLFATPKSRRYYFAVIVPRNRSGRGRYVRTGGYGRSWTVLTVRGSGVFTATLSSSMLAALFVGGNLAKRRQVAGHKRTGWQLVATPVEAWQADTLSFFFRLYDERLGDVKEIGIRGR